MKLKLQTIFITGILFSLLSSCSVDWTKAIRSGKVEQHEFQESINIDINNGLIFVPVTIKSIEYRFLFDSGAPLSISKNLQNKHNFKIVSTGHIKDSDHNRKKVLWAQVDSVKIGNISFMKQTAFIGDFETNPLYKCLQIDGIIGSNLIRQCNWTIDQKQRSLTLFNNIKKEDFTEHFSIPFKSDYQYIMYTDLSLGEATVKDVLVDYGSNGSIALNDDIFTALKNKNIIGETLIEKGLQQSGIVGKVVDLRREIIYSDSVRIDSAYLKKVMLRTGKTVSVGNRFLSRFKVTIDWSNKKLHLLQNKETPDSINLYEFKLGYSSDKGVYVLSVVEHSDAYNKGIRPNMKVLKIDDLDFESGDKFCDYVNHKPQDKTFLQFVDSTGNKIEYYKNKIHF